MDDAKFQIAHAPLDDPELPQQLDPDFYREALLHIARLAAERLLQERGTSADIERRSKIPLGTSRPLDAIPAMRPSLGYSLKRFEERRFAGIVFSHQQIHVRIKL